MATTFKLLEGCAFRITLEMLYRDVYCLFTPDAPKRKEFDFVQALFPPDFQREFLFSGSNGTFQQKYASNVCRAADDARPRFRKARDYLIRLKTADLRPYPYNTNPVVRYAQEKWEELLPLLQAETEEAKVPLHEKIDELLSEEAPDSIRDRLDPLCEKGALSLVLALLSVMASVLFSFHADAAAADQKDADRDRELRTLLLPPLQTQESCTLAQAREALEDDSVSLEAYHKLLQYSLKSAAERSEAQYLLYQKAVQVGCWAEYHSGLMESAAAGYAPALLCRNNEIAEESFRQVKATLQEIAGVNAAEAERNILQCCERCKEILLLSPAVSKKYREFASFILYWFISSGSYTAPSGETAEQFLEISRSCGYAPAMAVWEEKKKLSSIIPRYTRSESSVAGHCYFNTRNACTEQFQKTVPGSWRSCICDFTAPDAAARLKEQGPKRILLLDDTYDRNLSDLLCILQLIKENFSGQDSLDLELFIRHNAESARMMIDTALSHMGDRLLPIHIIDDEKIAAQQLLSQHPLFYPVVGTKLSAPGGRAEERPTLHFVVLGSSAVAEWLVREAFWMMGDKNNALQAKITLLAPDGEAFVAQLKSRFPGMGKDSVSIRGMELPDVIGRSIRFESKELLEQVAAIIKETPHCYFAVAAGEDGENLSLATKIREASIRTYIAGAMAEPLRAPFPIAFYCRQDNMAWLSRSMVIETEKQGNQWFNSWSLIPFGERSNHYSWEEIDGGTFQQLALCIHYQYSGISASAVRRLNAAASRPEEMDDAVKAAYDAKKAFFARQYNQDSSYSVALSLPYRIFQFQDAAGNRISPLVWNIMDRTVFSTAEQLRLLAGRISDFAMEGKEEDWKKIAEWEHARWVKWMLSRGWLPASFDEAVFAFQNGNPRQQLFVARLHPCICSYEALAELSRVLWKKCGLKKDFYTHDLNHVKATKEILSLEWVREITRTRRSLQK